MALRWPTTAGRAALGPWAGPPTLPARKQEPAPGNELQRPGAWPRLTDNKVMATGGSGVVPLPAPRARPAGGGWHRPRTRGNKPAVPRCGPQRVCIHGTGREIWVRRVWAVTLRKWINISHLRVRLRCEFPIFFHSRHKQMRLFITAKHLMQVH